MFRHRRFKSGFDLGIFDQVIWHLSRFETPGSSVRGVANIFGDHFHPVIALLAPLYWIAPFAETLIVAQATLFAASIVPVFLFARRRLSGAAALTLSAAYASFWGLQRAAAFDVHEIAFAPLVIAAAILALDRKQWPPFWIAACALMFIKEDLIPLCAGLGLYVAVFAPERRRQGILLSAAGAAAFLAVTRLAIPALSEDGGFQYAGAYGGAITAPWRIPLLLVTPPVKLETVALWLAPFAFTSLASPLVLLAIPIALTRLLSEHPNHFGTAFHYSAPLAPILAMSAADGLARIARYAARRDVQIERRMAGAGAAFCLLLALFLPGRQPLWRVFAPSHYAATPVSRSGARMLTAIPPDASVIAQGAIVPHLSHRHALMLLDEGSGDADYVVAAEALSPWPFADAGALRRALAARSERYTIIGEENGWTVMRRAR